MNSPHPSSPLTNTQLEILKAFAYELSEEELVEFREMVAHYFAKRAIKAADKVWDEQGWSEQTVEELLQTKLRKR